MSLPDREADEHSHDRVIARSVIFRRNALYDATLLFGFTSAQKEVINGRFAKKYNWSYTKPPVTESKDSLMKCINSMGDFNKSF